MANEQGNADIEGVLSSVLRLVSEDMRVPGRVSANASSAKLLLTAEQRVLDTMRTPGGSVADHSGQGSAEVATGVPLDEAQLRDLIRTILREELQGALGERITRSVRKLVVAEVHRITAARDLD